MNSSSNRQAKRGASELARITGATRGSVSRWRLLPDWPGDNATPATLKAYADKRRREWRGTGTTAGLRAQVIARQTLRIRGRTKATRDKRRRAEKRLARLLKEHPRRDLLAVVLAPLANVMRHRAEVTTGMAADLATFPEEYKPLLAPLEAAQVRAAARMATTIPGYVHGACAGVVEGLSNG